MESLYAKEVKVAIGAVQQAAKLSRMVIGVVDKGAIEKEDLSPVTVGDFAIQALLATTFHHAFPTDKFVGEETSKDLRAIPSLLNRVWDLLQRIANDEAATALCVVPESREQMCEAIDWCGLGEPGGPESGRVWIFDPIDGTKTFLRGEMYAINIALLVGGRQMVSVVGLPMLSMDAQAPVTDTTIDPAGIGSIMFAVRDHGTFVRPLPGLVTYPPRRIPKHAENITEKSLRSVTCYKRLTSGFDDIHKEATESLGVDFPGSDLLGWIPRYATLGLGLANMVVWVYKKRDRYPKLWDHAGAMLLFEEVGGKITDVNGKDIDITAGRELTANFGLVAAPKHLHATVLEAVQRAVIDAGKGDMLSIVQGA